MIRVNFLSTIAKKTGIRLAVLVARGCVKGLPVRRMVVLQETGRWERTLCGVCVGRGPVQAVTFSFSASAKVSIQVGAAPSGNA